MIEIRYGLFLLMLKTLKKAIQTKSSNIIIEIRSDLIIILLLGSFLSVYNPQSDAIQMQYINDYNFI